MNTPMDSTPDFIIKRVKDIIADCLGIRDLSLLNENTNIVELGADSLDAVEIVMALEDEFEIQIDMDEELEQFETIGGCINYISSKLK